MNEIFEIFQLWSFDIKKTHFDGYTIFGFFDPEPGVQTGSDPKAKSDPGPQLKKITIKTPLYMLHRCCYFQSRVADPDPGVLVGSVSRKRSDPDHDPVCMSEFQIPLNRISIIVLIALRYKNVLRLHFHIF